MKRWGIQTLRFLFVTTGVVLLTSVSIDATDALRGSQSALSALVRSVTEGKCPLGMTNVERPDQTRFCIDIYEAATGEGCLFQHPALADETARNANLPDCTPVTEAGKLPWTNVTQIQAGELCSRAGKRLPTNDEWYAAVRGTPDNPAACALDRELRRSGSLSQCRSGVGAYDMVGNVWEWVAETATAGRLGSVVLPVSGYVAAVDERGIPTQSSTTAVAVYNHDYIWTKDEGGYAVMRGGFYGGKSDSGIYSMHAAVDPQFAGPAIGFRCVVSL